MRIRKQDIWAALRTSLPIMVTFLVLGTGYGILMQKHGFGWIWSMLSGIVIFSGTVQFVSITMLSGGSVIMAAITALMVAARHIFFSISMIGRYRNEGKRKWYLFYGLCDETYAMLSKDEKSFTVMVSVLLHAECDAKGYGVTVYRKEDWLKNGKKSLGSPNVLFFWRTFKCDSRRPSSYDEGYGSINWHYWGDLE